MWVVILFLISFIGLIIWVNVKESNRQKEQGIVYAAVNVRYIGGFKEISGGKQVNFDLTHSQVKIVFSPQQIKSINISDIIDVECSTEDSITREVSLGRMLVFGALSFGMKKEKHTVRRFLVIKFMQDNTERSLVLEMYPDEVVSKILSFKNQS